MACLDISLPRRAENRETLTDGVRGVECTLGLNAKACVLPLVHNVAACSARCGANASQAGAALVAVQGPTVYSLVAVEPYRHAVDFAQQRGPAVSLAASPLLAVAGGPLRTPWAEVLGPHPRGAAGLYALLASSACWLPLAARTTIDPRSGCFVLAHGLAR